MSLLFLQFNAKLKYKFLNVCNASFDWPYTFIPVIMHVQQLTVVAKTLLHTYNYAHEGAYIDSIAM